MRQGELGVEPPLKKDIYLIALCSSPYLGPVTIKRLLRAFGSAEEVFRASARDLSAIEGVSEKRAAWIAGFKEWDELMKSTERSEDAGVRLVFQGDESYPEPLLELGQYAPMLLFVKGSLISEDRFAVAMVGSRKSSDYGEAVTGKMSSRLAGVGLTIVSGMARGIDTAAHRGAMKAGGRTIAVLGCGIDQTYPPENRGLMEKIASEGAVITEFPPGVPPLRENFPRRNRLISGLSVGVVVVEAAKRSGSLITARHALDQGKEVFAVPGSIMSETSEGTNELLKQGAKLVTSVEDVLEELAPLLKGFIKRATQKGPTPDLSECERALCELLSGEPVHVDDISRRSGLQVAEVLATLLGLELNGVVRQMEGKRFYLA